LRVTVVDASSHEYVPPPVAVNVMLVVVHVSCVVDDVIPAIGTDPSFVMVMFADAVHPLLAVTTTEYVPAAVTLRVADVEASSHAYVPPPDAVSVILVVVQES
jgi:hypothetical protein